MIPAGRPWEPDPDRQWDERHEREEARRESWAHQYEDPEPDRKGDDE